MNLYYNDSDIIADVAINYCVHDMYAERQSDTLVMRFDDSDNIWSKWNPKIGDEIRLKERSGDTGKMFIHSTKPENGFFTIRAMSMPNSGATKKTKSWEGIRFLQIANEIADSHGLTFQNYGCKDQVYAYLKQDNETDFALFSRLCMLECCQMLIYDGKLLAYNEEYIESQTPAGILEVGKNENFTYRDIRSTCYGSCEILAGNCSGSFTDPDAANTSVLRPKSFQEAETRAPGLPLSQNPRSIQCASNSEAARFAKGLLRNVNKYGRTGQYSDVLMTDYAAASLLNLSTETNAWSGPVFVYKVRHDYIGNKSTIYFRDLVEGY